MARGNAATAGVGIGAGAGDRPGTDDRVDTVTTTIAAAAGDSDDASVRTYRPRAQHPPPRGQRRVLLLVNDGAGLGHLARMARLAGALQGPCAALVVTGHRSAASLVPETCEFVHLPGIDSLYRSQSRYWHREPFLQVRPDEASRLRTQILNAVVDAFAPDAILVDHLPAGRTGELTSVLERTPVRKYLVLRGLIGPSPIERALIFEGAARALLTDHYTALLVACDPRIVDIGTEYALPDAIAAKVCYTGYVVPSMSAEERDAVRAERGLTPGTRWIVCSAGGGMLGEALVQHCLALTERFADQDVQFDIVFGPRSSQPWTSRIASEITRGHVRMIQATPHLPRLHASCDLLVCPGGYNSLVEAMAGATPIVVMPVQTRADDEQAMQARRVAEFYPVTLASSTDALESAMRCALARVDEDRARAAQSTLAREGLRIVRDRVFEDLGIAGWIAGGMSAAGAR